MARTQLMSANRRHALLQVQDMLRTCGLDAAKEMLLGRMIGLAEAYAIVDPHGFAEFARALAIEPPRRGSRPTVVVDNTGRQAVDAARVRVAE